MHLESAKMLQKVVVLTFLLNLLHCCVHSYKIMDKWQKSDLTYNINNYPFSLSKEEVDTCIAKAFAAWSRFSEINFTQVNSKNSDISIMFSQNMDNFLRYSGDYEDYTKVYGPSDGGQIYLQEVIWQCGTGSNTNLLSVALHSIGHVIGLDHTLQDSSVSIMYPKYKKDALDIKLDDIYGARQLYGPRTSSLKSTNAGHTTPSTTTTLLTTTTPSTTTTSSTTTTQNLYNFGIPSTNANNAAQHEFLAGFNKNFLNTLSSLTHHIGSGINNNPYQEQHRKFEDDYNRETKELFDKVHHNNDFYGNNRFAQGPYRYMQRSHW